MLAVVKEHLGPGFSVKEVPYPVLRDTDVIIKVRSVGICGSDGPILAGTRPVPYPLTPGHEFSGDVVEVGAGGDRHPRGRRHGGVCPGARQGVPENAGHHHLRPRGLGGSHRLGLPHGEGLGHLSSIDEPLCLPLLHDIRNTRERAAGT